MNREARCRRLSMALVLGSLACQSAVSARQAAKPSDAGSSGSQGVAGSALDGCVYTATDYSTPVDARYEMKHFGPAKEGFYYHFDSTESGKLVVLVAGLPEPHYFDALRARLLAAHYRVLILDLPGKEHTALSGTPTPEYIVDQYQELWRSAGFAGENGPLIVGTSIGGPVAALMAVRLKVQGPKLALVSAIGVKTEESFWVTLARIPVLSDLLAPVALPRLIEGRWRHGEILCPQHFPELFKRQETEFRGGFARINYLELAKALAFSNLKAVYQQLAPTEVPLLLAYGDHDVFAEQCNELLKVIPRAGVKPIRASGHIAFIEQPAATFEVLDTFLTSPPSPSVVRDPGEKCDLKTPSS